MSRITTKDLKLAITEANYAMAASGSTWFAKYAYKRPTLAQAFFHHLAKLRR